jgi:cystathionine gamma-lyase
MKFATKAIHVGQEPEQATGSVTVPVYLTSTYYQAQPGKDAKYVYSRTGNPTRTALEQSLASLEGGKYGLAFSSGMAATTTILMLLRKGDHVVACDDSYGGVYRLFEQVFRDFGLQFSYVDARNVENVESAVRKNTRMLWMETPTNPLMKLVDIRAVATVARKAGAVLVVDNTFMSPFFQNPLAHGADIVVHSTTKYLGGHSDLIGGAAVTSNPKLFERLKFLQNAAGPVPGPMDCWLVLRGIKTLALRMERHDQNARMVSEFLEKQPSVERVFYPGLQDHPQKNIVKRQMRGFGGMVSFELKGGSTKAVKFLKRLKVFTVAESLGGVESLIEHPASMTHASVPKETRMKRGITDGLIRVSVGIEDGTDLVEDLEQAFEDL